MGGGFHITQARLVPASFRLLPNSRRWWYNYPARVDVGKALANETRLTWPVRAILAGTCIRVPVASAGSQSQRALTSCHDNARHDNRTDAVLLLRICSGANRATTVVEAATDRNRLPPCDPTSRTGKVEADRERTTGCSPSGVPAIRAWSFSSISPRSVLCAGGGKSRGGRWVAPFRELTADATPGTITDCKSSVAHLLRRDPTWVHVAPSSSALVLHSDAHHHLRPFIPRWQ